MVGACTGRNVAPVEGVGGGDGTREEIEGDFARVGQELWKHHEGRKEGQSSVEGGEE